MRVAVIGAGPAGNCTAYLLAKKGHLVDIFERNPVIGPPVQCTGILSDYFLTLMTPKNDFLLNSITKTRIYAPNGNFIEAKIKKNYVICRKKFDNYLANLAKKAGVNYHLNHSFKSYEKKGRNLSIMLTNSGKKVTVEADVLVGADGANSAVAKAANLFINRKFVIGTQIEARLKNDNTVEFYPYLGCYAWIVPVNNNVVRIGVAAYKNTPNIFKKLAEAKLGKDYKVIENQSGVIPTFNPRVITQNNNVYIIGDAASLVKATSGGGINQSLKTAIILSEAIHRKKDYQKEWRKKLYRNLHLHLIVHKMMLRFTTKDWNELIKVFSQPKMKKILYDQSRDKLAHMMIKIAVTNPFLFRYIKHFPVEEIKNVI